MHDTDAGHNSDFYHDCYTWAVSALSHPEDDFTVGEALKYLEDIADNPNAAVELSNELKGIREYCKQNRFDLLELKKEHSYLFIGPFSLPAPPYESYYRHGGMMQGESSHRVAHFYKQAGMEIAPDFKDAPDHIVLEAEFMAGLCALEISAGESGDLERVNSIRYLQKVFLEAHLLQWLGSFRQAVEKSAREAFYPAAVRVLEKVALNHREQLNASIPAVITGGDS